MTEIQWLPTTGTKTAYMEVPGADVFITKVISRKDKEGNVIEYKSHIHFLNDGDKKVAQGDYMMVGLSDQYIFLRDGSDTNSGRRIRRPKGNTRTKPLVACNVDLDKSFGSNVKTYYDKAFKLQWSETNKAWFIAHTGEVKQKEVL